MESTKQQQEKKHTKDMKKYKVFVPVGHSSDRWVEEKEKGKD